MMSSDKIVPSALGAPTAHGQAFLGLAGPRHRAGALLALGLLTCFAACPCSVLGCAACYGQDDSPLAQGMNWGIISLLAVVVTVLGGFGAFFVFLAKKSVAASTATADGTLLANTNKVQP